MKASDYFKSMDEVKEYCERFKNQCTNEEYKALQMMFGIAEQEGIYREVEGIGKIDISIAKYIEDFNNVGLKTLASCSGLIKDHPKFKFRTKGYIAFEYSDKAAYIIKKVADKLGLRNNEGECYLKPDYSVRFEKETDVENEHDLKDFHEMVMHEVDNCSREERAIDDYL